MDTAVNEEFIPDVTEGKISLLPNCHFYSCTSNTIRPDIPALTPQTPEVLSVRIIIEVEERKW